MDRLNQIVKQRLADSAVSAEHPAADLLLGFVERSLRPAEQERVLDHLGSCSDCRNAVALATSGVEEGAARQAASYRPSLLRFPAAMRWASAAAALAVAAGIGLLIHQDTARPKAFTEAVQVAKSTPAAATSTQAPAPCDTAAPGCGTVAAARPAARPQVSARPASAASRTPLAQSAAISQPAAAVPHVSESTNAPSNHEESTLQRAGQSGLTRETMARDSITRDAYIPAPVPLPPTSSNGGPIREVLQSSPPPSGKNVDVAAQSSPLSLSRATAEAKKAPSYAFNGGVIRGGLMKAPIVHWSLSGTGQLQRRNLDDTITTIEPAVGVTFRAIATEGIEVWAGGSQSIAGGETAPALFHSSDAGTTWKQVAGPWKTTIIRIRLASAGVLTVATEDAAWQTQDGGQHWVAVSPQ